MIPASDLTYTHVMDISLFIPTVEKEIILSNREIKENTGGDELVGVHVYMLGLFCCDSINCI